MSKEKKKFNCPFCKEERTTKKDGLPNKQYLGHFKDCLKEYLEIRGTCPTCGDDIPNVIRHFYQECPKNIMAPQRQLQTKGVRSQEPAAPQELNQSDANRELLALVEEKRGMEKKLAEVAMQAEEEHRLAEKFKGPIEEINQKLKQLKTLEDAAETENQRQSAQRREVQLELEKMTETREAAQRERSAVKSRPRLVAASSRPTTARRKTSA